MSTPIVGELAAMITSLANLGATPAMQQLVLEFLNKKMGVPQDVIDQSVNNAKPLPPPKQAQ